MTKKEIKEKMDFCYLCGSEESITLHHLARDIPTREQIKRIKKGTLIQDDKGKITYDSKDVDSKKYKAKRLKNGN